MEKIKEYGLEVYESEALDRQLVDFDISDGADNVAWVWGDSPSDVEWECDHPYQCIEFGDDREEQGECMLCGSYCDWHGVSDENGHATPEPHEWYPRRSVGGLIGDYLQTLEES